MAGRADLAGPLFCFLPSSVLTDGGEEWVFGRQRGVPDQGLSGQLRSLGGFVGHGGVACTVFPILSFKDRVDFHHLVLRRRWLIVELVRIVEVGGGLSCSCYGVRHVYRI